HFMPEEEEAKGGGGGCDLFSGKWVRDYSLPPLYEEWECPYIDPQITCLEHGRPETDFRHWRWQPHGCSIPSFNSSLMLEALRGKRMMFVGDSLTRGQFTSMVCLLHGIIHDDDKSFESHGSSTVFTAKGYDATIEFYWAPFLLESNADDPKWHRVTDRAIRNGSIDKHGEAWKGADILIFYTYIWWVKGLSILPSEGSITDNDSMRVGIKMDDGYRLAMKSLVEWINENMDPRRQRAFFTSMSPSHQWSYRWGGANGGNCYNETTILEDENFFGAERSLMRIASEELGRSEFPITFLNITHLSSARKDAHTSIYQKKWGIPTEKLIADPARLADCIHWCLPGLQDVWNQLLFSKL
ncbi:hypothetical protein M569_13408, partial [Genlisea aurea]